MNKGNVLVLGNSGVGKSTLINAVLGEERAETGFGIAGTTKELKIYENSSVPFRLIDSVGFEPSYFKEISAIRAVQKWSKESAKEGREDTQINVIWFCVDGTAAKLFPKSIQNLSKATAMWPSVPVIVVITKSYSVPDREKNIAMVHYAFAAQKRYSKNLKKVIPVVAQTFVLNENAYAAPEGITELIDVTNELLPEGKRAAQTDVAQFKLNRKRALAHSVTGTATASAIIVGAVPIPFSDALILGPVEVCEITALARVYGIKQDNASKEFIDTIVQVGTISGAAKAAISALKAIPGINLGAAVVNAVIAGAIVAALGEGSIYAFEQVYLGEKTVEDIDWIKKFLESKLSTQFISKVTKLLEEGADKVDAKSLAAIVTEMFQK